MLKIANTFNLKRTLHIVKEVFFVFIFCFVAINRVQDVKMLNFEINLFELILISYANYKSDLGPKISNLNVQKLFFAFKFNISIR